MSKKTKQTRWGRFDQMRCLRLERLEARAMLFGDAPFIDGYLDTGLQFGLPHEGSNESSTDPVDEWQLNADLADTEGGTFNLAWDLDGDGNYGETGEPTLNNVIVPAFDGTLATVFTWNVTIDWDTMIQLGIADTHPNFANYEISVRAVDVASLAPGETVSESFDGVTLTVFNSMPFFGAVTATQAGGGGGCAGGGGPVTVAGSFTEYGINDEVTLRINWGDGNVETVLNAQLMSNQVGVPFSVDHTYASPGTYNISWEIFDDEGGAASLPDNPASTGGVSGFSVSGGGGGPSVCLDGGVLTVTGSTGDDTVTITEPTGLVRVESSFFPTTDFASASVQQILVMLGAGNDTLLVSSTLPLVAVGGDGNDILTGGAGRSILIGGLGSDLLYGDAGEDILVDGETTHDNNAVALLAMLAEWNSAHSFIDRVRNLIDGSGSVQGLNETPEGSFFLVPVGNDFAIDLLIGGAGLDWIIRNPGDFSFS